VAAIDDISAILAVIGQATITDEEAEALTIPEAPTPAEKYQICGELLTARGGEGNGLLRLQAYALAIDDLTLDISGLLATNNAAACNILIGASLE